MCVWAAFDFYRVLLWLTAVCYVLGTANKSQQCFSAYLKVAVASVRVRLAGNVPRAGTPPPLRDRLLV